MAGYTKYPALSVEKFKNALEENHSRLVREWVFSPETEKVTNRYYIDSAAFAEGLGNAMFSAYAESVASGKAVLSYFPFLSELSELILSKKVFSEDILSLVWWLRHSVNRFVAENPEAFSQRELVSVFTRSETACEEIVQAVLEKKFKTDMGWGNRVSTIRLMNEYRNAIDEAEIVSSTDVEGTITYANQKFCTISGYSQEELIGKKHSMIRHPDMRDGVFAEMWNTILSKKVWRGIVKNRKKNGAHYWVKTTIIPILGENNEILEFISIRTDITELKDALQKNHDYETALDEANVILRLSPEREITSANPLFFRCTGFSHDKVIGEGKLCVSELFETVSGDPVEKMWTGVWKGIVRSKNTVGKDAFFQTAVVPILDSNDRVSEYVAAMTDVTEIENAKEHLKGSVERLRELDQKKDDFINIASHEMRTPLTTVKGYLSMVLDGDVGEIGEQTRAVIEKVYSSADRLIGLLNDMLDIAKLESGKYDFHAENTDMSKLLSDICDDTEQLCRQKGLEMVRDIDLPSPGNMVDVGKIKQVFINLLGNAVKFTPPGGTVTLRARNIPKWTGARFQIEVSDTGVWIAEKDKEKVFEKFWQVKNSMTRDINGTGLGLTIVKDILSKMWWTVHLESEGEMKGAKFTVKL